MVAEHNVSRVCRFDHRSEASSDNTDVAGAPGVFTNALHLAVDHGATDVVRLLLRYGVEPNRGGVLSLGGGGGAGGGAGPKQRPSPRVSPTSVLSVDRRSLNTGHSSLMGSPSPRASPRASPRGSPRGSPRCSPRSGSPRPFSRPSSPLAGCDRGSPRAPSPRAASPIHFVPPPVPYCDPEVRLRPRPLPRQFGVGEAPRGEEERGRSRADTSIAAKRDARQESYGVEARSDSVKKATTIAKTLRNGASEERPKTAGTGGEQLTGAAAAAAVAAGLGTSSGEKGKEKSRSPGAAEGRSIIKEDPRPEAVREEGVTRKDSSTRRVSWVPGVTDKAAASRDKPAYKRRHSAVVRSSEVTFQRQRSFSLDSQQVSPLGRLLLLLLVHFFST